MNKKAFTLIELLVVILIIGILAAIALPQYQAAVAKSRLSEALSIIKTLNQAQQSYFLTNNEYADSADNLDISLPPGFTSCGNWAAGTYYSNGKTVIGIGKTVWGMGPAFTRTAACGWKGEGSFSATIGTNLPGGGTFCPAGRTNLCVFCSVNKAGGNIPAERRACESLGPYVGETATTYVYSVLK